MQFADPSALSKAEIEEGEVFAPKFDAAGLVTAVAVDARDQSVLMLAHMDREALALTLATGEMHYYSRSRQRIWKKGETSGEVQKLVELRVDCDQDALVALVLPQGHGAACHTGRKTCFYRRAVVSPAGAVLQPTGEAPLFDPETIYGKTR